jgi:hypothetical protein
MIHKITEKQYYGVYQEFLYRKDLAKKIEMIGKSLTKFCLVGHKEYIDGQCPDDKKGMNLQIAINTVLDKEKTLIPKSTFEDNKKGAYLLYKYEKINEEQYNNFINKLKNKKQVFINNKWHPVNKLNTNYTDVSILLSDLLIETYKKNKSNNTGGELKTIFTKIMATNNSEDIRKILMSNRFFLWNLLVDTYRENPKKLFHYIISTTKNSKTGEEVENNLRTYLEKEPIKWICKYQGGNGDYVDMIFSVDLIMEDTKGEVYTIQVKSNKSDADKFFKEYHSGLHQAVDMVVFPENDEFLRYNLK